MASRQAEFQGRDLYVTDPKDVARFLEAVKSDGVEIPSPVWEPAAGTGNISKTLMRYGYKVKSGDLIAYRDDEIDIPAQDFFLCTDPGGCKTIFTNPPFNVQEQFLEHSLAMGVDVILFVRSSFLSSIRRYRIFQKYTSAFTYIYTGRAHCYKNGIKTASGMVDYCVIMWKPPYKGTYKGRPVMGWIP
jgi:hypothetical protein